MTPAASLPASLRASDLAPGTNGLVTAVVGAPDTVERLTALGLAPGATLRVLQVGSPMTVAVGESRLALGRGWAEALHVLPL